MAGHTEDLGERVTEGGCTKPQFVSVDGTVIHWKKLPSGTLITREEKSVPGFRLQSFKGQADFFFSLRLTLLRGGANAAGGVKVKPVLTHRLIYAPSTQPVLCKWNNTAWMTAYLFSTWFSEYFKPTAETQCQN